MFKNSDETSDSSKLPCADDSEFNLSSVLAEISLEDSEGRPGARKVVRKLLFDNEDKENAAPTESDVGLSMLSPELLLSSCHEPVLHVEVAASRYSTCEYSVLEDHVRSYLIEQVGTAAYTGCDIIITEFMSDTVLTNNIIHIAITDISSDVINNCSEHIEFSQVTLVIHVYKFNEGSGDEYIEGSGSGGDDGEAHLSAATTTLLPNLQLAGVWESLMFDGNIKEKLVNYAVTSLYFSTQNVDPNIVSCNRLILLHGPPGTGKTSLARALAHKLSIRLSKRYTYCHLVEINSHSLFSKWFSESGKLVARMFDKIHEIIDDDNSLTFVLIDEVESLTAARQCMSVGGDPSDALRVVNAVLTRVDRLRYHSNVLVITTSNMSNAIDEAFLDRADLTQYVGLPGVRAIYSIYCSAIGELMKRGVISPPVTMLPYMQAVEQEKLRDLDDTVAAATAKVETDDCGGDASDVYSRELLTLSRKSVGLSGRMLRKIPFLAHALYIHTTAGVTLQLYLYAVNKAIMHQQHSSSSTQPHSTQ